MAETTDLTEIQKQLDELKDDTKVPRWWETQRTSWESRMLQMEANNAETQGYMKHIISLLSNEEEDSEPATPEKSARLSAKAVLRKMEKKPVQVTIIDEKEKYSPKPNEPGILSSIPKLPQNNEQWKLNTESVELGGTSMLKETQMGERNYSGNHNNQSIFTPRPKVELQVFDGENPRGWIRKCLKYFAIFDVPEDQKLEIAGMYLTGKAETWFDGYIMQKNKVTWQEFVADLCHRFSDKTCSDVIQEFNKLVQKSTVEEYQERFEELKPYILMYNSSLGEDYFVSSFISGLKEEIRNRIMVHEPKGLAEAYRKAKRQELVLEMEGRKNKYTPRVTAPNQLQYQKPLLSYTPVQKQPQTVNNQKQNLLDYRRANNLCFKCGEKFSPGHQCKTKQLNLMEEEEAQGEDTEVQELMEEMPTGNNIEGELEISINALTGSVGHSTLRIQGTIRGKPLNILVDSGSTHSFVTNSWAKEGLEVIATNPLTITVANGENCTALPKANN
ncbi:hypothetical protein GQ457_03G031000 [Hibiscus cannabinus]